MMDHQHGFVRRGLRAGRQQHLDADARIDTIVEPGASGAERNGGAADAWRGYRELTDAQLDALAVAIVARVGHPHCPVCGREITRQSVQQIVDRILALPNGARLLVLGPLVRDRKTEGDRVFDAIRRQGFVRVRVDGEQLDLDEVKTLDKYKRHTIDVVVDRLVVRQRPLLPGEMKAQGAPAKVDSPWMDTNVSLTCRQGSIHAVSQ